MYRIPINNQCSFKVLPKQHELREWAIAALKQQLPKAWLSMQLVDEAASAELNTAYRNKPTPTNVLSFSLDIPVKQALPTLGDLVICPGVIWQEALDQDKAYRDHFCHIVIHGVLHLLGFDHSEASDARVMESLEIQLLAERAIANPYE